MKAYKLFQFGLISLNHIDIKNEINFGIRENIVLILLLFNIFYEKNLTFLLNIAKLFQVKIISYLFINKSFYLILFHEIIIKNLFIAILFN